MQLTKALVKLTKRKKRNGYYEASQVLTVAEKQSILIALSALFVPLLIAGTMLLINMS